MTTSSTSGPGRVTPGPGRVTAALAPIPLRPLRRDAERNRQRILEAAAEVFTERGFAATLDDVARHAGVGVGTVYRRFPDKAALADALFDERIDALVTLAEQARDEPDAWAALVGVPGALGRDAGQGPRPAPAAHVRRAQPRPRAVRPGPDAPGPRPPCSSGPRPRARSGPTSGPPTSRSSS